jgi:hypothetical protein
MTIATIPRTHRAGKAIDTRSIAWRLLKQGLRDGKEWRMRAILWFLGVVTLSFLLAAETNCASRTCTDYAQGGLILKLHGAETFCDATVTVTDSNGKSQTLRSRTMACDEYLGYSVGVGTFDVVVNKPGFREATAMVMVTQDDCHIIPVTVDLTLQPELDAGSLSD